MKIVNPRLSLAALMLTLCSCNFNTAQNATAQTAGNDPAIKKGETFFYSKSVEPKKFDFICFLGEVPTQPNKYLMIYRLCGLPGDIVQIKNGDLYLNNKFVDNLFSLKHNYLIAKQEFNRIKNSIVIDDNYSTNFDADTLTIPMDDQFVLSNRVNAKRQVLSATFKDSIISNKFSQPWNQDNFGPIKVPENSYFVLGDNRHNAWDSRYRGFISKDDLLGTVIQNK